MLILFVALILFGGDKFPEIARGLGKGIREFKDMSDGVKREIHSQINNYDLDPNRSSTTNQTPATPPDAEHLTVEEEHLQTQAHETHNTTAAPPDEPNVTASTAQHEPDADAPAPAKPDLSQPPNTISHQSY